MRLILQTNLRCRLEKDLVAIAKLIDIQEQTDQVDNEIAAYVLESAFKPSQMIHAQQVDP